MGNRTALVRVDWEETSGVDYPANEVEQFLIMKAAKAGALDTDDDNDGDVDDSTVIAELLEDFLDGAPKNVTDAAQTVIDYIAETQDTDDEATEGEKTTTNETKKAKKFGLFRKSKSPQEIFEQELSTFVQSLKPGMSSVEKYQAIEQLRHSLQGE